MDQSIDQPRQSALARARTTPTDPEPDARHQLGSVSISKDNVSLLNGTEESERCGSYTCRPQISSLTAASLGMNGMLFGMLIILATGMSSAPPETAEAPAGDAGAAAAPVAGAPGCGRSSVDVSRDSCSGNGILFDDAESCTCFDCWTGDACEEQLHGDACVVHAAAGTPLIFEDYWVAHPEAEVVLRPSYHIGYGDEMPRLENAVRALHAMFGNADLRGQHLVFGIGSTELINAALYALATTCGHAETDGVAPSSRVWAESPYYSGYRTPASFYESRLFHWDEAEQPPTPSAAQPVIEMVTSPNNPDGLSRSPQVAPSTHTSTVMDYAYYWPHFVAIGAPVAPPNRTVGLFTLSKLTGHASTRIGWALTPDADVAAAMRRLVEVSTLGVPRESKRRATVLLEHVNAHGGEILTFARDLMLGRWERLEACFASSAFFSLQAREAASRDAWSGADGYEPSPAYAWIHQLDGGDATASMRAAGIVGRSGAKYGAAAPYVRLELLMREATFDVMLGKLCALVQR